MWGSLPSSPPGPARRPSPSQHIQTSNPSASLRGAGAELMPRGDTGLRVGLEVVALRPHSVRVPHSKSRFLSASPLHAEDPECPHFANRR